MEVPPLPVKVTRDRMEPEEDEPQQQEQSGGANVDQDKVSNLENCRHE